MEGYESSKNTDVSTMYPDSEAPCPNTTTSNDPETGCCFQHCLLLFQGKTITSLLICVIFFYLYKFKFGN